MDRKNYWIRWFKCALVRALKTFAQSAVAGIPVAVSITEVQWTHVLGTAALAFILSMLTSVAGLPELEGD